jgi:hypothetical protein
VKFEDENLRLAGIFKAQMTAVDDNKAVNSLLAGFYQS